MLIQKAFQYELRPDGATRRAFSRFAGAKRFVWNAALKQSEYLGYANNCAILPQWKIEKPWLLEIHSQVLQQGLKDLDKAFKNFFEKRARRPASKKKGKSPDSFRFPQGFKIEEGHNRIYLPKIGWVSYRNSRSMAGAAKNITITRKADKWFASIQTEFEVEEPVHPSTSRVGVDLGVSRFASLSDGTFVEPLNALKKRECRLRRYQRMMARQKKDFLHQLTTMQTKTHSLIVIEDLKVCNMSSS